MRFGTASRSSGSSLGREKKPGTFILGGSGDADASASSNARRRGGQYRQCSHSCTEPRDGSESLKGQYSGPHHLRTAARYTAAGACFLAERLVPRLWMSTVAF